MNFFSTNSRSCILRKIQKTVTTFPLFKSACLFATTQTLPEFSRLTFPYLYRSEAI
jgi:hypothetical protein